MALIPAGIAARLLLSRNAQGKAPEQIVNGGVADPVQTAGDRLLSRRTRKRMLEDPEYLRAQEQIDLGRAHLPYGQSAGVLGALAQGMQEHVGRKEAKGIEGRYQGEEERQRALLSKALEGYMAPGGGIGGGRGEQEIDPKDRELIGLMLDSEGGSDAVLQMIMEQRFKEPPGPKYQEVGGALVAINPDGTVNEKYRAPTEQKLPADVQTYQFAMDQIPEGAPRPSYTEWKADLAKAGRAPAAPRAPTQAEERYNYLISQGVPPERAKALAYGVNKVEIDANGVPMEIDPVAGSYRPLSPSSQGAPQAGQPATGQAPSGAGGVTPPKLAQARGQQNDRIDVAMRKLDEMLASDRWQEGSGLGNMAARTGNAVAGMFGGEPSPEMTGQRVDVAQLRQAMTEAMNDDPRTNEGDFKRMEELLPGTGLFDSGSSARTTMAEARKFLEEIRNRPLPVDPRTGDSRPAAPSYGGGNPADPLGILK